MGMFEHKETLIVAALALLAVCSVLLLAQNSGITGMLSIGQKSSMIGYLQEMATLENRHVAEIPDVFKTLFGNARVNGMIVLDSDELILVNAVVEDNLVKSVTSGQLDDPTVRAITTEATIRAIAESKDPATEAVNALENGRIKYEILHKTPITGAATVGISIGSKLYLWLASL